MQFEQTNIDGLYIVYVKKQEDERGLFARTFCKEEFKQIDFDDEFVQFNHSFNKQKGTVRGMHFQMAPCKETKLIRCVRGSVYDVAVDIRKNSPTFLQHFAINLSEKNMISILIPEGFAHGFQTMEDNSSLIYHHTSYYKPEAEAGLRFSDPSLNITWQLPVAVISDKDRSYPLIDKNFKGI